MKQAASLLARLENDEELYKEKLIEIEQESKEEYEQFREIVDVFDRTCKMELEIENQTAENREIEARCFKYELLYAGKSRISKCTASRGSPKRPLRRLTTSNKRSR